RSALPGPDAAQPARPGIHGCHHPAFGGRAEFLAPGSARLTDRELIFERRRRGRGRSAVSGAAAPIRHRLPGERRAWAGGGIQRGAGRQPALALWRVPPLAAWGWVGDELVRASPGGPGNASHLEREPQRAPDAG